MELCVVTGLVMSRLRRFRLALLIQNFLGVCGYHNAQGDSCSLTPFSFHAEFIRLDSSSLCSPSSCTKPAVILSSLSLPSPPTLLGTFFSTTDALCCQLPPDPCPELPGARSSCPKSHCPRLKSHVICCLHIDLGLSFHVPGNRCLADSFLIPLPTNFPKIPRKRMQFSRP
jgi:hypothetical protein